MKKLKQIISALLCAVMVFGTSVVANAQDNINFDNIVVNPAYENILDEEDISEMLEGAEGQSNENQNALSYSASTRSEAIYTTVNSAAEYVRDRMVERQSNIVFSYKTTTGPSGVNDLYKSIVTAATSEELSVGFADGDYLKWSWGGYRGEIQYTFSSGEYTYTFSSDFVYYTTAEQEKQATAVFQSVFNELNLSTKTDYNKICEIYNYVCKTCDYYDDETDSGNKSQFTSYGAIVNHTAVCQGYATAIYRLCKMAGVKSRVITSTNHAWNIVKLGDYYYNVDATWDDSSKYSYDKSKVTDGVLWGNFIYHTYFLKSDNDFSGHIKEAEYTTEVFKKEYPISSVSYYLYEHNAGTQTHTVYCPVCDELINASEACTIKDGRCIYCTVSKVTGLATTAIGSGGRTLTLSWNAVEGATGYNVYVYNRPADSWTLLGTVSTNKYIDETVTPNYEYYYRVAAVSYGVEGLPSDTLHTCAAWEPISVSVSPTSQSIYKSYSAAFTAYVDGTASHTVEWSIIGTTTDENTKITAGGTDNLTGTLQIGANETATALTVRATSVADNTKYAEATVSILDQIKITKIELSYDTEKAPFSSELTHREWNNEYCNTLSFGTGTLAKNKLTSNYHLLVYDYDKNRYFHTTSTSSDQPEEYRADANINPELTYYILADAYADTGYYFDTENLNNIEFWVNGKKYDNVIIEGYNQSWNSIAFYIPVSEKALCSHSFTDEIKSEETLAKAGTCAAEAEYYYTCSKCAMIEKSSAHTFKGEKDLTNHIGKTHIENAVVPDYENYVDGYTGDTVCNGCNKILEKGTAIIVNKPTPPAKVTGLKTSARGANGVNLTLSWNAVDGATGYNVYGYNKPADSWTLLDTVTTNKYISPTTPGYEYYFRVAAVNGDVEGTPSDALHTCAACETMDAPSVIASNDKTIQVDWNLVGSHGYVLMWSKDASFKTGVSSKYITGHSKSNYTISVPSGASQYYVRVRAWRNWETGYVYGSWSEGVKAGQTIAKVTGLKTSARGANGVNLTISWNAQAAADSYNVYGYNKANDSWTLLGNVTTNKYISPTTPGYEYIFRVAAVEDGREGVPSERLHTCAACETMKAPTVQKSGSQIKVNWEIVGSHGYVVMWSTDPTFKTGVSSKYITGHSVNNYTITGINSNQAYYVRVRAWRNWDTGYVYGSWSESTIAK